MPFVLFVGFVVFVVACLDFGMLRFGDLGVVGEVGYALVLRSVMVTDELVGYSTVALFVWQFFKLEEGFFLVRERHVDAEL